MVMIKKSLCVLAVLVLMLFMVGVVSAETRIVTKIGTDANDCTVIYGACLTIQYAINRAEAGDTIIVGDGDYDDEALIINKSNLILNSSGGAGSATINGSIIINASGFTLGGSSGHGFQIINLTNGSSNLFLINLTSGADNVEISYNVINTTKIGMSAGVVRKAITVNSISNLENITIYENTFWLINTTDEGIVSDISGINTSGLNITKNTFNQHEGSYLSAISITIPDVSSLPTIIQENTINNAERGISIGNNTAATSGLIGGSYYFKIDNNIFYLNNISIDIINAYGVTNLSFQNITIKNNNFSKSDFVAIAINASQHSADIGEASNLHPSNFTIKNNVFENNSLGINKPYAKTVIAEEIYGSASTGPGGALTMSGGGAGVGDNVTTYVDFSPWCTTNSLCVDTSNIQVRNITIGDDYYFALIQNAIDNASKGDIIEVGPGNYTDSNITVNQEVTIIGNGTNMTTSDATNFTIADGSYGFNITADNVKIENMILSLANSTNVVFEIIAIQVLGDNIVINNTVITTWGNKSVAIKVGAGNFTNYTTFTSSHLYNNITNLTIMNNEINITDIATGILASPTNFTRAYSNWNITGNTITAPYGYTMQLCDLNDSEVSLNNLTTNNETGLGNFIWASAFQNISSLVFINNILNNTKEGSDYGIVSFKNISNGSAYGVNTTLSNINITANTIKNWGNGTGLWIERGVDGDSVLANSNNFSNDEIGGLYTGDYYGYAVRNDGTSYVNATLNYWGNITGPGGNGTNGGGRISTYVTYWRYYTNAAMTTLSAHAAAADDTSGDNGGGGSAAAVVTWKYTYNIGIEELETEEGYTREVAKKQRVRFKIGENYHHVGVKTLTESTVTIEVSSEVQEASLVVGDIRKFDVTEDGFYDLSVVLNSITGSKADITIKKIYEEVTVEAEEEEAEREAEAEKLREEELKKKTWTWIIIGIIVVVLILVGVGYGVKKKRR